MRLSVSLWLALGAAPAVAGASALLDLQKEHQALYARCAPSVVLLSRVGSEDGGLRQKPVGSGFLIEPGGLLVTNAHVADELGGYGKGLVRFSDGTEELGTVVYIGSQYANDLAFVRLSGGRADYPFLSLGDSAAVLPGDIAFALGYPHALQLAFTHGIINGVKCVKSPFVTNDNCFLQSQVITEPGNSGGPLLNIEGQVIGVNTNIPSPVKGWTGISFALPVDRVKEALSAFRASAVN
ncbi:MAG: trypsin-like peptidase domain-containing protein [Elusimicrobiota bacterium]